MGQEGLRGGRGVAVEATGPAWGGRGAGLTQFPHPPTPPDFQNYLRTQTGNTTTINIIICTVDYLLRLQVPHPMGPPSQRPWPPAWTPSPIPHPTALPQPQATFPDPHP